MEYFGLSGLGIAFAGAAASIVCFLVFHLLTGKPKTKKQLKAERQSGFSDPLSNNMAMAGHISVFVSTAALTLCCVLLVYCFMTENTSLEYVVQNQSRTVGGDAWLYRLAGLWGGREGSLLFWTWLISVFNTIVAVRNLKNPDRLNTMALFVAQLVLIVFVSATLFSESNLPFKMMDPEHFDASGNLIGMAKLWGMNFVLEHWAMAIHPPTLFIGYAGFTIPFAYAISALIVNDPSKEWVERSTRYALFSWLFLGLGIGLGAIWAYVVLGWGGYWGWDPVENASLLSWLVGLALIHSFTMYRTRNAFRRWAVMCSCLTLAFVVMGTFITRSGVVDSVHAFGEDPVSHALFLILIIVPALAGIIGLLIRWKSFGPSEEEGDLVESLNSRDTAYYLNNVLMVGFAILLCYLTISSSLPTWLPFGGETLPPTLYNTIARPFGILYCLLMAVCPLLSWKKTAGKKFIKQAWLPGVCALALFALLAIYWAFTLIPSYQATILAGGTAAETLREYGAAWYYNGLALVGFLAASLLFFNALFLIIRNLRAYGNAHNFSNPLATFFAMLKNRASLFGGFLSHLAMGVILVGLIGSSMYVTEKVSYLAYDTENNTVSGDIVISDYRLEFTDFVIRDTDNGAYTLYELYFDVYKNGTFVSSLQPSVQMIPTTQDQKVNAAVISFFDEDLFLVFRGATMQDQLILNVRINPLVSFVWIGFALMMLGTIVSVVGCRHKQKNTAEKKIRAS